MTNLSDMRVRYRDIIRATDSNVLVAGEEGETIKGQIRIAAGSVETIHKLIKENDIVLVCGSLYILGDAIRWLRKQELAE